MNVRVFVFALVLVSCMGLGCGDDSSPGTTTETNGTSNGGSVGQTPQEQIHGILPVAASGDFWAPCDQEEYAPCAGEGSACVDLGWAGDEKKCSTYCVEDEECGENARCDFNRCIASDSLFYWFGKECGQDKEPCPGGFNCVEMSLLPSQDPNTQKRKECRIICEDDSDCSHLDEPIRGQGKCLDATLFEETICGF